MNWSELAWKEAQSIYRSILQLPFVRELSEGTLSRQRFDFYISQDAIYIDNYSRVLAHIASRIPTKRESEDFMRFALDGIMVEKALHESFIDNAPRITNPSPTCMLYMAYETSKGFDPIEIEVAAVLPCFWIYQRVGEEILKKSTSDNPYRLWIETYADETFAASTRRAIEICDSLAEKASPETRNLMTETFLYTTKMEWMFWDSAYNLEQWKI